MYPEDEREPADDPAAQTQRRISVSPQRGDRTAERECDQEHQPDSATDPGHLVSFRSRHEAIAVGQDDCTTSTIPIAISPR
jgi:hypothetical protein